jgi:hypothetical protein
MNRLQECFDDDAGESWNYLFQGLRHDPSTPLMNFAARNFSPAMRAWMNGEPCGYVDRMIYTPLPSTTPSTR